MLELEQRLEPLRQKIDAMQVRERVLMFAVAVVVAISLLQMLLIEPVMKKTVMLKLQHKQAATQIAQKKIEKQQLEMLLSSGVNKSKLVRKEKLAAELESLNQRIESSLLTLIPPKLMPEVLERVLLNDSGLVLISLENKPVIALIEQKVVSAQKQTGVTDKPTTEQQGLYKHSFVIRLEGSYPAAIDYFQTLSELPWRFNWDALHYEVTEYPKANISLEVHTVSMSEDWIGV